MLAPQLPHQSHTLLLSVADRGTFFVPELRGGSERRLLGEPFDLLCWGYEMARIEGMPRASVRETVNAHITAPCRVEQFDAVIFVGAALLGVV